MQKEGWLSSFSFAQQIRQEGSSKESIMFTGNIGGSTL